MGRGPVTTHLAVFYGLPVTISSLAYASIAWRTLAGPSRFLDLVSLRKRRGNSSGTAAVDDIPLEVWEDIRGCLIKDALLGAKDEVIPGLKCWNSGGCGRGLEGKEIAARVRDVYEGKQEVECPHCGGEVRLGVNYARDLHRMKPLDTDVPRFLAAHGLAAASKTLYPVLASNGWAIAERLALLSLPTKVDLATSGRTPRAAAGEILHEEADEGNPDGLLFDFDPRTPVDADERFKLVLRRFKLEPGTVKDGEVSAVRKREEGCEKVIEPRWRIYLSIPSSYDWSSYSY